MEQIWNWGIDLIIQVQKIRTPFIDTFFIAITSLGTPEFYTLFLPGIYWCFDKKYAARIITIFFISSWTNSVLKNVFSHPRPFDLNGLVKVSHAGGPGLPSGHAQQTVALWGSLVLWLKNRFFIFFCCFYHPYCILFKDISGRTFPHGCFRWMDSGADNYHCYVAFL